MGIKNTHAHILVALGKNIQKLRNKQGISQEKLAELISMHRTYVGLVERGERNLTIRSFYKICKALKVKSNDLIPF